MLEATQYDVPRTMHLRIRVVPSTDAAIVNQTLTLTTSSSPLVVTSMYLEGEPGNRFLGQTNIFC